MMTKAPTTARPAPMRSVVRDVGARRSTTRAATRQCKCRRMPHRPDLRRLNPCVSGSDAKPTRLTTPSAATRNETSRRNQSQKAKHPAISRHAATTKMATFVTIEQRREELTCTGWSRELHRHRPPVWLDDNQEAEESAASALRFHRLHDESNCAVSCRERQPMSVGESSCAWVRRHSSDSSSSRRAAKASGLGCTQPGDQRHPPTSL